MVVMSTCGGDLLEGGGTGTDGEFIPPRPGRVCRGVHGATRMVSKPGGRGPSRALLASNLVKNTTIAVSEDMGITRRILPNA